MRVEEDSSAHLYCSFLTYGDGPKEFWLGEAPGDRQPGDVENVIATELWCNAPRSLRQGVPAGYRWTIRGWRVSCSEPLAVPVRRLLAGAHVALSMSCRRQVESPLVDLVDAGREFQAPIAVGEHIAVELRVRVSPVPMLQDYLIGRHFAGVARDELARKLETARALAVIAGQTASPNQLLYQAGVPPLTVWLHFAGPFSPPAR